jgi:hypothetical protein
MGKLDRIAVLLLPALWASGCSSAPEQPAWAKEAARRERAASEPSRPAAQDPRFDVEGRLKPSGAHVSWLELPSGFRARPGNTQRLAAYEASDMPFDKVRAYLDERLVPKNALYLRTGFEYQSARPTHTALAVPPMHVTLLDTNRDKREVRIVIEDLTVTRAAPLSTKAAAELLAKARSQQD